MRTSLPFIAGNWKMHKTIPEAIQLAEEIKEKSHNLIQGTLVVIPPFTALYPVYRIIRKSPIKLGAQNVFWEEEGAYTGEVSPKMLLAAGCQYVILGHSERRQYFGETDTKVNKKIKAVLRAGLNPIFCLGEVLEQRQAGKTLEIIRQQLDKGLSGLQSEEIRRLIIAYEPVWAIGTGLTATPDQAQEVHAFIRQFIAQNYGNSTAEYVIILYGGSVKPNNAFSLIREKDIDGALVGGASLKAESFLEIAQEAVKAYEEKK
jgi:triosephosphate isomerase